MNPPEFRRQIFRDFSQWDHGVSSRLQRLKGGGVALYSRPTFSDWSIQSDESGSVTSLAVDHCGRIFWIRRDSCQLYRYDPISKLSEAMVTLADCGGEKRHSFGRMISVMRRLWILDLSGSRAISLRTDTFQIIAEIPLTDPIDIAWGGDRLFALDGNGISAYDVNGRMLNAPRYHGLSEPIALGANPNGRWLYVVDACKSSFLRFKADGSFHDQIGKFSDITAGYEPTMLAVNPDGNLFVCDEGNDKSNIAHEFSADGGYIGGTGDLNPLPGILGMTFDAAGNLYAGSPNGIARFGTETALAGSEGVFYGATLDSGGEGNDCWHRVDLIADLKDGGALEVFYASSDEAAIARAVNDVIEGNSPTGSKADAIEALAGNSWHGPEVLQGIDLTQDRAPQGTLRAQPSHSILLSAETKRYLWLKIRLSAPAPKAKAAISEMRVYYPRLSYLRYLPRVYQEDPASREFLQRYLSIFETVFNGLEATIERIPEVFDPERTPKEFLDWLAQWLDLGIEEDWPAEVKSRLIQQAASLYQNKGRPDGLADFIEIVVGSRPVILESFETRRPFILGERVGLGMDTRVFRRPMIKLPRDQRTVLGSSSLGASRIRAITQIPINPFRAAANHFTLLLDLSAQEFQRHERGLNRIIRENSPAHVAYDIRLVSGTGLGSNMTLGVNSRAEDPQPLHLGHSILGRSILSGFSYGPEIGIKATLAGRACGSKGASEFSYGEQ
jgi:phage tail-like protein